MRTKSLLPRRERLSLGRFDAVDLVDTLQECFGVHPRNGQALLAGGLVLLDGETLGARDRWPPLGALRGKTIEIRGTGRTASPWGMPTAQHDDGVQRRPIEQLELVG